MSQPSILITGATGLLGRACLPHLMARHGANQILALVRHGRDTTELESLGVRSLEMDLGASNLGIPDTVYRTLAKSVRSIVHAAADIRFGIPLEESRRVNVIGTENLLRFARHCLRLERFAQISTVYVWGGKPGYLQEQPAHPLCFFNTYQQAKFEAEQITRAAMAEIPASIYRFSTMVYDRSAARVAQFNYFHELLRLAARNPLRAIPALPGAKIDLIASDWGARIFDFLFEERWLPGEIVHICAGSQNSLTVRELLESAFDGLGLARERPEILSQDEFDADAGKILSTPSRRRMWQNLAQFLPHLNVDQAFECTRLTEAISDRDDLRLPDPQVLFREALSYCIATQWGQGGSTQLATTT